MPLVNSRHVAETACERTSAVVREGVGVVEVGVVEVVAEVG